MKKLLFLVGCVSIILVSCKKPEVAPPPAPDAAALISFNKSNLDDAEQHFIVNANATIYVVGAKGTVLYLPPNQLLDSEGNIVNGNVDVTLIEVTKKSEMLMLNIPTMGKKANGDHATLESGGEFYVSISKNGVELVLASPLYLTTPATYDPNMRKFVDVDASDNVLWGMAEDSLIEFMEEDTVGEGGGGYFASYGILPGEWGWTNIDKFYLDPRPKTTIFAEMPEGFDNTNCEVFISYDGTPGALARFDTWIDGRFTEHYGLIPIGLEVHFIAVGIVDGELHYAIEAATITADHVQTIDHFTVISEAALITLIEDLP